MTRNPSEIIEFTAYYAVEMANGTPPHIIADEVKRLLRLSSAHGGLAVASCNVGLTPRQERRDAKVEASIRAICAPHGIKPIFSGDPRGCTVKLRMPSGATNDWGREGICVPQR